MITRIAKRFLDCNGLLRVVVATRILKSEVRGLNIGFQLRPPVRLLTGLIATAMFVPRVAWAQPFAGCGNAVPPHLATVDEQPPNQPVPVTNVVAVFTAFEISHANRVAMTSMLATHLCVYMAPSAPGAPPQYVTIYIAKDDFIDPVAGDREPGHTVIHQQSNVQVTAPTSGGYQLIQLLPGPVQITGPIVWLGVRYTQHNQQFVQGFGPVPPSMIQDGLAYVGIHRPIALPFFSPLSGGDWIDYNYLLNPAGQRFLYGQRPAIRALELIVASGACCDPSGGCANGSDYLTCTSSGGVFQGHASSCLGDQNGDGIDDACTACCQPSGACSLEDPTACSAGGGTPQLGIASCPPGLCAGACCLSSGFCLGSTYPPGCNASGGTFQGYGSTCTPNPCPGANVPQIRFVPNNVTVLQGASVTLQVFLESPPSGTNNLKAYQMTLPDSGSATVGTIGTLTHSACGVPSPIINRNDPSYVFDGLLSIAATTTGPPPRFTAALLGGAGTTLPAGTTSYLGEITYVASGTANGSFEISLVNPNLDSFLRDQGGVTIPLGTNTPGALVNVVLVSVSIALDPPVSYGTSFSPVAVTAGDFNADGHNDLATVGNNNSGDLWILENNGTGGLLPAFVHSFGVLTPDVLAVDVTADGAQDLAATVGNSVVVLFNNGSGGFSGASSVAVFLGNNTTPVAIVAEDFDGDCDTDLAAVNLQGSPHGRVLRNDNGLFTSVTVLSFDAGASMRDIAVGDMDADGDPDLVVANSSNNDITVFKNDGAGNFGMTSNYVSGLSACLMSVVLGDWDKDCYLDIATSNCTNQVAILFNTGTGALGAPQVQTVGDFPWHMTAADVDGDDDLDLVAGIITGSSQIQVLRNDGAGSFAPPVTFPLLGDSGPRGLTLTDLDGDGKRDVAVALGAQASVATLLNSGLHDCDHDGTDDASQPTGSMAFAIFGASNATDGDWEILGPGFYSSGTICVAALARGAAFAEAIVENINANSCPSIRATRLAGLPNGFRIDVPALNFDFCVGPPMFPRCCFPAASSCSFNPDLVLLSETDCNKNFEDDAIDLYVGTSLDENGNHIPDECEIIFGCTSDKECNDGLFCNGSETCDIETGECLSGPPPICDDGRECTLDACSEAIDVCEFSPLPAGTACGDASAAQCDGPDACDGELNCIGNWHPDGEVCDDGNACTFGDSCNATGQCAGVPPESIIIVCSEGAPCPEGTACRPDGFCTCCATGDVDCNGSVDLDDILFVLDGFGNPSGHANADIHPCGGNGVINLDDILWVLDAFAGENLCP